MHFDSGWNSELSVQNIEKLVKKLNFQLFTVVCDWREMKDLQRSFFRSSVINCDVPQDHAFIAVLWRIAAKFRIKYIIGGHNINTEAYLPRSYRGYVSHDWRHINSIQKQFGTIKLKKYPHVNLLKQLYFKYIWGFRVINLLNYLDYNKHEAMDYLRDEFGWLEYRGSMENQGLQNFFKVITYLRNLTLINDVLIYQLLLIRGNWIV